DVRGPSLTDGWSELSSAGGSAALEVLSARLPDGALFQGGKSTEPRAELLGRVRRSLLVGLVLIGLVAAGGGDLLTRAALQPSRAPCAASSTRASSPCASPSSTRPIRSTC